MWVRAFSDHLKDEDAMKKFLELFPDSLRVYEDVGNFARQMAEDPEFVKFDSSARLSYIKRKTQGTEVDPHYVAAITQIVYGLNTNMNPIIAMDLLLAPYGYEIGRQRGVIGITKDGKMTAKQKKFDIPFELRKAIEKNAIKSRAEQDEIFEKKAFFGAGSMVIPTPDSKGFFDRNYRLIRDAYLKKFGQAKVPYVDLNPFPHIQDFVLKRAEHELGLTALPKYRFSISETLEQEMGVGELYTVWYDLSKDWQTGEYIISLPRGAFLDEGRFLAALASEWPHLLMPDLPEASVETKEGRIKYLKQLLWHEGVSGRFLERVTADYLHSLKNENETKADELALSAMLIFGNSIVPDYLIEANPDIATHTTFSHFLGWYLIRELPREVICELASSSDAYLSKRFAWNGAAVSDETKKLTEHVYHDVKQRSFRVYMKRDKGILKKMRRSFQAFENDWQEINGQIMFQ